MEVFVIIVSYNFERWMEKNLNSLRISTMPVQVVVVDNCSCDKTTELIQQNFPEVTLIKNQKNEGFGKANNIGIEYALKHSCDYVFLLNQDAWIEPDVIETLVKSFEKFPKYGILSPTHLNGKGDELDYGFSAYTNLRGKKELDSSGKAIIPSNIINAAFWMIPSKILHLIGGFSPVYFHTGEDIDYINRLHYHGYKAGYCPTVFGYHDRAGRKQKKEDLVFQLIEYSNINYSFFKAFGYGVLAGYKKAFIALRKEGISEFIRLFAISTDLAFKSRLILRFRKINKKPSNYYFQNETAQKSFLE